MSKIKTIKDIKQTDNFKIYGETELEEYNRDIETAMNEMDSGEYILHEEVIKILLKNPIC